MIEMEKNLDAHMDKLMNTKAVTGVLCANDDGLCLQARGTLQKESAGVMCELIHLATKLEPSNATKPVVCLESDTTQIMICSEGKTTLAVHKSHSSLHS